MNANSRTLEHAEAYAKARRHAYIVEKNGELLTAKDDQELAYAESRGWNLVKEAAWKAQA